MIEFIVSLILAAIGTAVAAAFSVTFPLWAVYLTLLLIFWLGIMFFTNDGIDLNIFD